MSSSSPTIVLQRTESSTAELAARVTECLKPDEHWEGIKGRLPKADDARASALPPCYADPAHSNGSLEIAGGWRLLAKGDAQAVLLKLKAKI